MDYSSPQKPVDSRIPSRPNIALIGVMGSGKSAIGTLLARMLNYGFIDTDEVISQHENGATITEIFQHRGESEFRAMEKDVIRRLDRIRSHVISVGGGTAADPENMQILKTIATVVWINTSPAEIARRIVMRPDEIRRRPLLADLVNIESRTERESLLRERLAGFVAERSAAFDIADINVAYAYATPENCAVAVKSLLQKSIRSETNEPRASEDHGH